jgi:hypothetical protein
MKLQGQVGLVTGADRGLGRHVGVLADERSRFVEASLARDHDLIYPETQAFWDALLNGTPL